MTRTYGIPKHRGDIKRVNHVEVEAALPAQPAPDDLAVPADRAVAFTDLLNTVFDVQRNELTMALKYISEGKSVKGKQPTEECINALLEAQAEKGRYLKKIPLEVVQWLIEKDVLPLREENKDFLRHHSVGAFMREVGIKHERTKIPIVKKPKNTDKGE